MYDLNKEDTKTLKKITFFYNILQLTLCIFLSRYKEYKLKKKTIITF